MPRSARRTRRRTTPPRRSARALQAPRTSRHPPPCSHTLTFRPGCLALARAAARNRIRPYAVVPPSATDERRTQHVYRCWFGTCTGSVDPAARLDLLAGWAARLRPTGCEARTRLEEGLRQDLHVREDGHEVRIARPARYDVEVHVVDYARACHPA